MSNAVSNTGPRYSPTYSEEDSDVLVSTPSASSESDVFIESSTSSEGGKVSMKAIRRTVSTTSDTEDDSPELQHHSTPVLRKAGNNSSKTESTYDEAPSSTASTTSTASIPTTVRAPSPRKGIPVHPSKLQLAPVLANLISVHQDYLDRLGVTASTVSTLIDIVSVLPYGLRGDARIGSGAFFHAMRHAIKRVLKPKERNDLQIALEAFNSNSRETKEAGRQRVNLMLAEILRALKNDRDNAPEETLDATMGGSAAWLQGDYETNPFSLAAAFDNALEAQGGLLEKILGRQVVDILRKIAASLPVDLGGCCYDSPTQNKNELLGAVARMENPLDTRALLHGAALSVSTDPDQWETFIENAMRSMKHEARPKNKHEAVRVEIRTACYLVFNVLQAF